MSTTTATTAPTSRYTVIFEHPAQGWQETMLGIFDSAEEAREAAGHWLEGYKDRHREAPRMAIQEHKPQPLPEGAVLI